jgi:hypothetical protein
MLLYHGTTTLRARMIEECGVILPRSRHKLRHNYYQMPSNPRSIYLTDAYALYFAYNGLRKQQAPNVTVFEIDGARLDPALLRADEDAVEQVNRGKDGLPEDWDMRRRTFYYRDVLDDLEPDAWKKSLQAMGTCQYQAAIPLTAVTRVAHLTKAVHPAFMMAAIDPTITVVNYQIVGNKYKAMLHWLFNGADAGLDQYAQSKLPPPWDNVSWLRELPRDGITISEANMAPASGKTPPPQGAIDHETIRPHR